VGERRLVIAVGNPLRRDDGAGAAVLECLRARVPTGVELVGAGGEPSELMDAWDGAAQAVVVDAVRTGAEPGSLHRFDASAQPLPARTGSASTHGLGLAEALELGRALGRLPQRVVVVGIEAGDEGQGAGLSEPVAAAVEGAAALVLEELGDA
jgi:hydrogenase maturation protease